ncbi:MAG: hypothetical protein Q8R83_06115 [Legionellaceae bacterium]|nr:hypothetical protein [Legionellaceae bacterium]
MAVNPLNWTTAFLDEMEIGSTMSVAEVQVHDKAILVQCIKQYIDWYGGVEFSSDYAAFRRIPKWSELVAEA